MIKAAVKPKSVSRVKQKQAAAVNRVVRLSNEIRGYYDSAKTTDENTNHWADADMLSARAALSPAVRRTLRVRCRYEVANSPLARSILRRAADFVAGSGPRVQIKTVSREYNRAVEKAFSKWGIKAKLPRKLWQMKFNKAMNGEAIAVFFENSALSNRVKLDIRTIEADQLCDPSMMPNAASDGIIFDDFGNPLGYKILRHHPGDTFTGGMLDEHDTWRAEDVIHWFDADRPGQIRGVPEITSSLDLFAMRRRYIKAVVAAAETAADLAVLIKTQSSPEDPADIAPLDMIDIVQRMAMTLPKGWDAQAFKGDQPQTTLDMFDAVLIREIARCMDMPYGIAAGDSSSYNFASGKLDHLPWFRRVQIEQDAIEDDVAERIFERWFNEAVLIDGHLPPSPDGSRDLPDHQWFWDGQDLLDPREAGAKDTGLRNGSETHARIFARRGEDPIEQWEAQAELLGMTLEDYRALIIANLSKNTVEETETGEPNEDQ